MAVPTTQAELVKKLAFLAEANGVSAPKTDDFTVTGQSTAIRSKWWFGARQVTYKFKCILDSPSHQAKFREGTFESSWGLPPPAISFQTSSQVGTQVTATRSVTSLGGGGVLHFGKLRGEIEKAVQDAGWTFVLEAGCMP